jgi:hypothetical protein
VLLNGNQHSDGKVSSGCFEQNQKDDDDLTATRLISLISQIGAEKYIEWDLTDAISNDGSIQTPSFFFRTLRGCCLSDFHSPSPESTSLQR